MFCALGNLCDGHNGNGFLTQKNPEYCVLFYTNQKEKKKTFKAPAPGKAFKEVQQKEKHFFCSFNEDFTKQPKSPRTFKLIFICKAKEARKI